MGDEFGDSVAFLGGNILVGARGDGAADEGTVYLFDGTTGQRLRTILNPDPGPGGIPGFTGDLFGASVAALGNNILVGAYFDDWDGFVDAGSVYLFDGTTGEQLDTIRAPDAATGDLFGFRIGVLPGNVAVSAYRDDEGAGNSGSVYLFDSETLDMMRKIPNPDPDVNNDQFGLSMTAEGDTLVHPHRQA